MFQVTRLLDSTITERGSVDSGLARELAVTLVHAPDFDSKVGMITYFRTFIYINLIYLYISKLIPTMLLILYVSDCPANSYDVLLIQAQLVTVTTSGNGKRNDIVTAHLTL